MASHKERTEAARGVAGAEAALKESGVVPYMTGSLGYMKEVRDKCLAAGIPAAVAAPAPGRG